MELIYRRAGFDDLNKVAELYNEFLFDLKDITRDPYFDFMELSVEDRTQLLKERFLEDKGFVVIAMDKGSDKIVGFISMAIINCFLAVSSIREIGYIEGAYVQEPYRRRGILGTMEMMVSEFLKNKGIRYLELNTIANNQMANDSWEKLGYQVFRQQWRKDLNE